MLYALKMAFVCVCVCHLQNRSIPCMFLKILYLLLCHYKTLEFMQIVKWFVACIYCNFDLVKGYIFKLSLKDT